MRTLTIFVCTFLAIISSAEAAKFCVAGAGLSPQCIYDDAQVCMRAADPPNTSCSVNPDAALSYSGNNRYCTVSSNQAVLCIYTDRNQCNDEASRRREICIDRIGMNEKNNPYKNDPRVQY